MTAKRHRRFSPFLRNQCSKNVLTKKKVYAVICINFFLFVKNTLLQLHLGLHLKLCLGLGTSATSTVIKYRHCPAHRADPCFVKGSTVAASSAEIELVDGSAATCPVAQKCRIVDSLNSTGKGNYAEIILGGFYNRNECKYKHHHDINYPKSQANSHKGDISRAGSAHNYRIIYSVSNVGITSERALNFLQSRLLFVREAYLALL